MEPKSISASSIATFEACEARYKAENIDRIPQPSGRAAALGTVVHGALEDYIAQELHLSDGQLSDLHAMFEERWWEEFDAMDDDLHRAGKDMLARWYDRNRDWSDREVLSTEAKERFMLPVPGHGEIPVTYIWDRCDAHTDGDINVVDYKTYGSPLPVDALKERIQPRLYALAAFIKFKDRDFKRVWVTYDLLRYEEISVAFTRDECVDTWHYLQRVAQRIFESNGTKETLNDTCRWCVRRAVCETLQKHAAGGGMLGINTLEEAIDHRARVDAAAKALYGQRDELDAFILHEFEERAIAPSDGLRTEHNIAIVSAKNTRKFPVERVARILGPDLMAANGSITLAKLDKLLTSDTLTDDQKSKIEKLIRTVPGKPTVRTRPYVEYEEE